MSQKTKNTQTPAKQKNIEKPISEFTFGKKNYILLLIGLAFIILGFILMTGGGSDDPNIYNPEIFSFRRITLAPILILIGYTIEIFAIMKKVKVQ